MNAHSGGPGLLNAGSGLLQGATWVQQREVVRYTGLSAASRTCGVGNKRHLCCGSAEVHEAGQVMLVTRILRGKNCKHPS